VPPLHRARGPGHNPLHFELETRSRRQTPERNRRPTARPVAHRAPGQPCPARHHRPRANPGRLTPSRRSRPARPFRPRPEDHGASAGGVDRCRSQPAPAGRTASGSGNACCRGAPPRPAVRPPLLRAFCGYSQPVGRRGR
jgi:hypothetical protein